jgi:hypothetical protein
MHYIIQRRHSGQPEIADLTYRSIARGVPFLRRMQH